MRSSSRSRNWRTPSHLRWSKRTRAHFRKLAGSHRSVFKATERPTLRPLPPTRYELCYRRSAKVSIDYHISVDGHVYSVPSRLVRGERHRPPQGVDSRSPALQHGHRSARAQCAERPIHDRSVAQDRHAEWTPSRLIAQGVSIGPATGQLVEGLLGRATAPDEQRGQPDLAALSFDERRTLLLELEQSVRHYRNVTRILQLVRLR